MILIIDSYDSFTFNLVQLLGTLSPDIRVVRNDAITGQGVLDLAPDHVVLGPGPGTPASAGNLLDIVRTVTPHIPTLGVCLGHQALGEAFGARVVHAPSLMHGKASAVHHDGKGLFAGLPNPLEAGRYHSLVVEEASLPAELLPLAHSRDGVLMALRHATHPAFGVQFHPESILTPQGVHLLRNFLRRTRRVEAA